MNTPIEPKAESLTRQSTKASSPGKGGLAAPIVLAPSSRPVLAPHLITAPSPARCPVMFPAMGAGILQVAWRVPGYWKTMRRGQALHYGAPLQAVSSRLFFAARPP